MHDHAWTGQTIDTLITTTKPTLLTGAQKRSPVARGSQVQLIVFKKQYPGRSRQYILAGLAVHALCNSMKEDFERAEQGYAKVAGLISNFPELANFRRFQTLNIQNLLYMQAEITHLECDLKELATEDLRSGKNLDHHYDWWSLAHDESESARQQWQLIQEIRSKLEKYSEHADPHMHTALSVLFKP
jgi:hypothetical protein